ncbi:phosphoglycerate kinase [Lachnospiraceae bacterium OttesenSCG-928-E19]|nr:phosphoglycerate kinase [Lachnospiraceae bacterium OttesenSCG-928-E19]
MQLRTLDNIDVRGKFVLLRDDFNVQIVDGKINDAFRIEQSMPTINKLRAAGAKIAICAHLGRPHGERNMAYTLKPIADYLNIPLIDDCLDRAFMDDMSDGDIVLLENVRFYSGEEKNDPEFAKQLADGFDIYVNDAFAVSHRAHASTVGVTEVLHSYAGDLLVSEIEHLSMVMENPKRPLLGLVSGAKIKSKLGVIRALAKLCDHVIVAGGLGTSVHVAMGMTNIVMDEGNIEKSNEDEKNNQTIREIMAEYGDKIILPVEKGVAPVWERDAPRTDKMMADIKPGDVVMDEGPASVIEYNRAIDNATTMVWNGTVGMAEWPPVWSRGTYAIAEHVAERSREGKLISIIGGGDTVTALEITGTKNDMTYVSTGGGAFMEFIEGKDLPGIKVLEKK